MNIEDYSLLLNESLQRCLENDRFLSIFYALFLESSDEIRGKFDKINLEHQINMMSQSLDAIISVSEANWESDKFLTQVAKNHKQLDIKPEYYDYWEESLLKAVSICDFEYDENTEEAWKHILKRGIEFMQSA
jgi:hemoglobin-like flavoprotein